MLTTHNVPYALQRINDVLPHHKSRSYIESCSASLSICISHLLYDSHLFHKKAGAFSEDSGSRSGHGQILVIPISE